MNMKMMECQPWFQLKTFRLRQHWLVVPEKRWFFHSRFCGDEWWQIWVEYGLDLWVELPKFPNVTSALSNKLRKAYLATSGLKHGLHVLFWRTDYGFWHSLKIEALHWLWGPNVAFCSHNRCAFSHVFLCFISGLETEKLWGAHGHIPCRQMCMLLPDALSFSQGVWNSKLRKLLRCEHQQVYRGTRMRQHECKWTNVPTCQGKFLHGLHNRPVISRDIKLISQPLVSDMLSFLLPSYQSQKIGNLSTYFPVTSQTSNPGFPARLSWLGHPWTFEAQRMAFSHRCWWRNGFHGGRAGESCRC